MRDELSSEERRLLGLDVDEREREWKEWREDVDGVRYDVLMMGDREYVEWLRVRWEE